MKLIKIKYTAYQCHLFGTSIYLYFNPYCLANILREWSCMHGNTVKCWYVDLTVQFYWDRIYTVGWPSGLYNGVLGFQGAKPIFRPIVLAQAVSSLPVEPNMMLFTAWNNPHKAGQACQATINQRHILSKQLFNVYLLINNDWILAMNISIASQCSVSQWI